MSHLQTLQTPDIEPDQTLKEAEGTDHDESSTTLVALQRNIRPDLLTRTKKRG